MTIQKLADEVMISTQNSQPPSIAIDFSNMTRESERRVRSVMEDDFYEAVDQDVLVMIERHLHNYLGAGAVGDHSSGLDSIYITVREGRFPVNTIMKHAEDFLRNRLALRVGQKPTGPQPRSRGMSHNGGLRP